jgi:cytidylate kinase
MYRAVTLAAFRAGIRLDPLDVDGLERLLETVDLDLDDSGRILLDGASVGDAIRSEEVTRAVSTVSACKFVRERMVALQREFAERGNLVAEGRDLGTVVFPDARHRFFLDASPEERARRRMRQNSAAGREGPPLEDLVRAMRERDRRDSERKVSPLRVGHGVVVVDTTGMTLEQVVRSLLQRIGDHA